MLGLKFHFEISSSINLSGVEITRESPVYDIENWCIINKLQSHSESELYVFYHFIQLGYVCIRWYKKQKNIYICIMKV